MTKVLLTFRERQRRLRNKMYAEYLKKLDKNPKANKSEIKRNLAKEYGYTSEASVNTIIWEIEKNNGKKAGR